MGTVLDALLHPFVTLWRRSAAASWRRLPYPDGEPEAHSPGPDADRVLLLGGSIAVGYGVLSHDLALGGNLARRIGELTTRGTLVKIAAKPGRSLADAPTLLDALKISRFDAVVVAFGGVDAPTFMTPQRWRRDLVSLLEHIHSLEVAGLQVFVLGIPDVSTKNRAYATLANRRIAQFNAGSGAACDALEDTTFLPISNGAPARGPRGRDAYGIWALEIAVPIAERLNANALCPVELEPQDETLRQAAVARMSAPTGADSIELSQVLTSAKQLFGVAGAAVNIIDGDRQRVLAASGGTAPDLPREESLCNFTVQTNDVMVIGDALRDRRYRDVTWTFAERGFRFYAGFPIEAPDGERVGALCIVDREPREFSTADSTLLRELALQAQAILWAPHVNSD